jgi:hypothetical protein
LNPAFDAARSFIRYGTEPTEQLVREKCDLDAAVDRNRDGTAIRMDPAFMTAGLAAPLEA